MKSCDCHDHPLEHAIWVALETYHNAVPPVQVGNVFGQLRQDLEEWQEEQAYDREQRAIARREQASADGEIWPEPETCADCGHEPHEGACKEWVSNHTFGVGGLDERCQCQRGDYET